MINLTQLVLNFNNWTSVVLRRVTAFHAINFLVDLDRAINNLVILKCSLNYATDECNTIPFE